MKSSPIIDISASAISALSILVLMRIKPDDFEMYIVVVPVLITVVYVVLRYMAVILQISDYETFAAVSKLKKRKKYLHSCLNDQHLSQAAIQKHQQNYEKTTCALDKMLDR